MSAGSRGPRRLALLSVAALLPAGLGLRALAPLAGPGGALVLAFVSLGPGLALVSLLPSTRASPAPRRLLLALALSPIVAGGSTVAGVFGVGLALGSAVPVMLWGSCLALAVAALGSAPRGGGDSPPAGEARLELLPGLAFGALALALFLLLGNRISYHPWLHAGVVAQISAGLIPPENPALAGEPLSFYWLYHWLLAVHAEASGHSILVSGPLLSAISLFVYVGASVQLLRRFLVPRVAAAAAVAVGFAANWAFPLGFAAGVAASGAPDPEPFWPFQWLQVGGLGGDPRLPTLLGKFLNVGGFALGRALWSVLLDELVPARGRAPSPAVVFAALCSVILFHTTTALAAFPALALGFASLSLPPPGRFSPGRWIRDNLPMAAIFAAALVATSPYLWLVTSGGYGAAGPFALQTNVLLYNVRGLLLEGMPLLPIALLGLGLARSDPAARFTAVATLVVSVMALGLALPDHNQYKLVHVASLPGGLLLFQLLAAGFGRAPRACLALGGVAVAGALAAHGITAFAYTRAVSAGRDHVAGEAGYLALPGDPELDAALHWLRDNTPVRAVVVSEPVRFGASPVRAVSGRGEFVLLGGHHSEGNPELPRRYAAVKRLLQTDYAAPSLRDIASTLERPLYLLLTRERSMGSFDSLRVRFDAAPAHLERVFDGKEVVLYAIHRYPEGMGEPGRAVPHTQRP